jgi:hypothetical protein
MNWRFVMRGGLLAISVVLLAIIAVFMFTEPGRRLLPPSVPPVPVIHAPRGTLPTGQVGLVEQALYAGGDYHPVGRGFIFQLPNNRLVGVTTAHSVSFGSLLSIALARHESTDRVFEADTLQGEPGVPRSGEDMTVDYVLLKIPSSHSIDPALILQPDQRDLPQPGERVSLFTVQADQPRVFDGAVLSAEPQAVWVVMDEVFEPSGLSGSPFISQYTGKVIGMAIATTRRGDKVLLGVHPIASLVAKAQRAQVFSKIENYRR